MKHTSYLPLLLLTALLSQVACSGEPSAPLATEFLPVAVQTRFAIPGETIPNVRIAGGQGTITVQVTTSGVCATVVDARISRASHDLAIVTRVWANPAAACIAMVQAYAAEYQGTISSLAEGTYRVRIFEGLFDAEPRLIGSAVVTVSRPAA
jgi:hypothetical protein